jgi:hypothetical protein
MHECGFFGKTLFLLQQTVEFFRKAVLRKFRASAILAIDFTIFRPNHLAFFENPTLNFRFWRFLSEIWAQCGRPPKAVKTRKYDVRELFYAQFLHARANISTKLAFVGTARIPLLSGIYRAVSNER